MPNGFEAFAQNAIALGATWRERRRERKLADAMTQFDTDPMAAIQGVTKVDPIAGWNMRRQIQSDAAAAADAQREKATDALKTVTGLLGPAANDPNATPESLGAAYDSIMPILSGGLGMSPEEIVEWKQMFVANPSILRNIDNELRVIAPGGALVRGQTEVYRNPTARKFMQVRRGDGGVDVIELPTDGAGTGGGMTVASGVPSGTAPAAAPAGAPGSADEAWNFILPHEGGYAPSDANGKPVNFGINQGANPDVDVKSLTPDGAKQLFIDRYWNPSGAANLPAPLSTIHADTYYINPSRAQEFLSRSGGDPTQYLQLRQAWHDRLVKQNPGKYGRFEKAWRNRVNDLGAIVAGGGGAAPVPAASAAAGGQRPGTFYSTPGKTGPGAKSGNVLSIEEVAELGLSPSVRWQRKNNGEIVPIGGVNFLNKVIKQDQVFESIMTNSKRMEDAAAALINDPGLERAAGIMSYAPSIRGGKASDFEVNLQSLKDQIGFAILNDMRQMSPTGGALGNVSNFEVSTLQRNIAALDITQSPAKLRANIRKIVDYMQQLRGRYQRAYRLDRSKTETPKTQGGNAAPPQEAIDMLRSNPSPHRRQQFDQIFGSGAAKRVLGGN